MKEYNKKSAGDGNSASGLESMFDSNLPFIMCEPPMVLLDYRMGWKIIVAIFRVISFISCMYPIFVIRVCKLHAVLGFGALVRERDPQRNHGNKWVESCTT